MYFASRTEAGQLLAEKLLSSYRYENVIVVALSDSAVLVGLEIAVTLHCGMGVIAFDEVEIPGEGESFGSVNHTGGFSANQSLSEGQRDNYYAEYHGSIDQQKMENFQHLNRLLADGGVVDKEMLRHHTVILVADGLGDTIWLDASAEFLKTIKLKKLIIACPVASVTAVDRMHILADEIQCLNVTPNFFDTNHYYDINEIPSHEQVIKLINQNVLNWR